MGSGVSPAFEHRVRHQRPPGTWHDGLPLGNGELGVMMWGDGDPLAWTLDHAALWDLRRSPAHMEHPDFNYAGLQRLVSEGRFAEVDEVFEQRELRDNPVGPTKISIGRAELTLGKALRYECGLQLGTATVEGTIQSAAGTHRVQAFVHRGRNVFCLRLTSPPAEARLGVVPLAEMNDSLAALGHPRPEMDERDGRCVLRQRIPEGPACAAVWNPAGPDFLLAVETAGTDDEATRRAEQTWLQAADAGFDALAREHAQSWEAFWAGSAIYLPESPIEFLWFYGLYLLASASRRGSVPPGLQGLWPMDGVLPPWRGDYHADMNVQETFWPAFASGHLELADNWCDLMRDSIPAARAFTRRFFGTEGTFWLCCTLPGYTSVPCWHTVQFAWSHSGWLGWLVWLRWRYSLDRQWLAETGYPVIAEIFRFFRANLVPESDGLLHVPLSASPEYRENKPAAWCKDPNIDLALIRRCCDWVVEMEEALGSNALTPSAREVRGRLAPYSLTDRQVLCLWPGKPLDESHRHPSHLMAIHPGMDLTIEDGDAARRTIRASLEHYWSLGQYQWAGHTYAQMASFAAVTGQTGFAYDCLRQFLEYWVGPNGLHFNRDLRATGHSGYRGSDRPFTLEASCAVSAGISDLLVQGWRDTVRVFPAVPDHWRDVAFRDLLTEGAFRVSALRRDRRTLWVRVTATAARTLRLRNPFADSPVEGAGAPFRREGDLLVAELQPGQSITLWLAGQSVDFEEEAVRARRSDTSRIGLR